MGNATTKGIGFVCAILVIVLLFAFIFTGDSQGQKTLVIAVPSGNVAADGVAHILERILEDHYDVEVSVEYEEGPEPDTVKIEKIFESMDNDVIHIQPMVSVLGSEEALALYVDDKQTAVSSPHSVRSITGLCVSRKVSEEHNLKTIAGLRTRDASEIFAANQGDDTEQDEEQEEQDTRAEILVSSEDADNVVIEEVRAKSHGYDNNFKIAPRNERLLMKELDTHIKEDIPVVFQCQSPHAVWVLYDVVMLEEDSHNPREWNIVYPRESADWLEESEARTGWKPDYLRLYYAKVLEDRNPDVARFLNKARFRTAYISQIMKALEYDDKTPQEYAREWVERNDDVVQEWIQS